MDKWLTFPWADALTLCVLLIGGLAGILLLINKYVSGRWLGLLIISHLISLILLNVGLVSYVPISLGITSIILYLYAQAFFSHKKRVSWLHLMPVVFLIGISLFIPTSQLVVITSAFFGTGYSYLIIHLMFKESKSRGFSYFLNPGSRIVWYRNFIGYNFLFLLIGFFDKSALLYSTFLVVLIGFILYQFLKESAFLTPVPLGNKYKKSTLNPQIKSAILNKIEGVINDQKFYLRDDASLSVLAKELGVTTHHLSQVLNESLKISFQDLMTRYRIREACKILRDEQYQDIKIENVATMVGYNSKSAFNTAFKKRTGHTPSEYREAKNVRTYGEERLSERKEPSKSGSRGSLNHVQLKINSDMIQHFFKIFGRNIRRNGLFSFLNVLGLTVGFTCSILIYLFITDEQSYDKSIPDYERIYRISWLNDNPQTRTPHPMAQAMVNDFPEVESAVSISPWYGSGLSRESIRVKNVKRNIFFEEPDFYFADSTFWQVFDLEFVEGDEEVLSKPFSLVITETMANKYFGEESAIGQELELNDMPLAVSAVVKPMEKNSHFHFNAIIPYVTLKQINPSDSWMTWADFGHFNYLKLKDGSDHEALEAKIPGWILGYLNWREESIERLMSGEISFKLQPISDIHLQSHLRWELENNGNILYIYILGATLVFLILIASINYVNLTTAKSIERAKEIGVRKTLGAVSRNLSVQFYLESILFCLVALAISLGLSYLLLDGFNHLTGKDFSGTHIFNVQFLSILALSAIVIGALAGFYPAMSLSAFKPTEVLKGKLSTNSQGVRLRGILVVLQFTISAVLIAGSLIIFRQIDYMKQKELGFDKEAIISLNIPVSVELGSIDLSKVYSIRQQIETLPGVLSTSTISNLPGGQFNQHPVFPKNNPDNSVDFSEMMVDFGIEDLLGLEIVDGRSFNPSYATDTAELSFVINEIAVQQLDLEQPVGEKLIWVGNDTTFEGTIVGVVKDFHYKSLHNEIQPLLISVQPYEVGHLLVKFDGNRFGSIIDQIESIYEPLTGDLPFEYHFLDQQLTLLYDQEVRTLNIFSVFAGIALLLASLGLLGMAIAMLNQRIKEVGMRKILGASSSQIMFMILGQFAKLVVIALLIGLPLAYILMQGWMQEFSYQVSVGVTPFIVAILILLTVSVVSVFSAVMKITYANPIDSLRYE